MKQKHPCQTSNINSWFECFWFLIVFLLYPNIRLHQPKESNLLLQKTIKRKDDNHWNQLITNKTNSKQFALKHIPQKYICKKFTTAKNLKRQEANCMYQHYKGQEQIKESSLLLQKKIKEKDAVKIPQSSRKMISKIRI